MMTEVQEPGELPVLRELSACKKTQKSPLHKSMQSDADAANIESLQDEAAKLQEERNDMANSEVYAGGRSAHHRSQRRLHGGNAPITSKLDPSTSRSPPMDTYNMKVSNRHAVSGTSPGQGGRFADRMQQESLRNHLEKLGILGESSRLERQVTRGTTLPKHSHILADVDDYDHGYHNTHRSSSRMKDWLEWSHHCDPTNSHHFHHPQNHGVETLVKQKVSSKQAKTYRLQRHDDQTLSPLVLNPHDSDNHSFGQANQASFTLDEGHSCDDETYDPLMEAQQQNRFEKPKTIWRPSSTLLPPKLKQAAGNRVTSHAIYSLPMSHSRGPGAGCASETEFLDLYDVDALELPTKVVKDGKQYQTLGNRKQGTEYSITHENEQSPLNCKSLKGSIKHIRNPIPMPQLRHHPSHPSKHPEVEPLPLLTELEDYNASDDLEAFSIMGDETRKLSKRKLVDPEAAAQLQLAVTGCNALVSYNYQPRSLSQKYRPKVFEEMVGQPIVTQALSNAILKGRIAPAYIFHGSRGTGKTSAARIFASALTCISSEGQRRPCRVCRECISMTMGKSSEVREVDAASNNGIERVKTLLEETTSTPCMSRYKVFIIDECHVLSTETWTALLKILEEPPMNVVFILITTDPDQLPRTAISRCQKFPFPKIKQDEIVTRLMKLAGAENLAIGLDILQLIASRSDGSLRDAETTLDQVTLLGEKINTSTLHELVGSTSDEKLLGLLDSALLADTINTVRRARELVDSGVEPLSLVSRLVALITDILAGSFTFTDTKRTGFFQRQTLSEAKLQQLRMAIKILSDAEKQLRVSNDRTTWLTATLLQLGPERMYTFSTSFIGTSVTQSPGGLDDTGDNEAIDADHRSLAREVWPDCDATLPQDAKGGHSTDRAYAHGSPFWRNDMKQERPTRDLEQAFMETKLSIAPSPVPEPSCLEDDPLDISFQGAANEQRLSPNKLDDIWRAVMEKCHAHPLRQLLASGVKLLSIEITEVNAIVYLEASHLAQKCSCERFHRHIANLFDLVLGFPIEIRISLASLPPQGQQNSSTESSTQRDGCEPHNNVHIHPEQLASKPHIPELSWHLKSFPGIQHRAPSYENQCLDSVGSSWKNTHSLEGWGQAVGNRHNVSEVETLPMAASKASPIYRAHKQPKTTAAGESSVDTQNEEYYKINQEYRDEEVIVNGIKMTSPCSRGSTGSEGKNRLRHQGLESARPHAVDGSRSCDTMLKQGEHSEMLQNLSETNCAKLSLKPDPKSPAERGSYLRVPRFASSGTRKSETNKVLQSLSSKPRTVDLREATGTQKGGKLSRAASGFARLIHGKLRKQEAENKMARPYRQ